MTDHSDGGLLGRLQICVDRAGGKRALAAGSKFSEAQLYRYLAGETVPPSNRLLAMARISAVDPGWLLTGEGKPEATKEKSTRPAFRPELLMALEQMADEVAGEMPQRLTPAQRGKIVTFMYEAARCEELRAPEAPPLSKADVRGIVNYLSAVPIEETVDLHMMVMAYLEHYAPLPARLDPARILPQWIEVVGNGYLQYYNKLQGDMVYSLNAFDVPTRAMQRLHAFMSLLAGASNKPAGPVRLLDVGCGNGRELAFLVQHYPWLRGVGVDVSPAAVAMARTLEAAGKLPPGSVVNGNMLQLPFPDTSFEAVYSRQALFNIPLLLPMECGAVQALREMARVVVPGGVVQIASLLGAGRAYAPFRQYYSRTDVEAMVAMVPELTLISWVEPPPLDKLRNTSEARFKDHFVVTLQKNGA